MGLSSLKGLGFRVSIPLCNPYNSSTPADCRLVSTEALTAPFSSSNPNCLPNCLSNWLSSALLAAVVSRPNCVSSLLRLSANVCFLGSVAEEVSEGLAGVGCTAGSGTFGEVETEPPFGRTEGFAPSALETAKVILAGLGGASHEPQVPTSA